ncbi:hypothetical protein TIFTF001_034653 [Ficus carica]|uniref:Uncharacterized protein n=1 Tax=Ficus carica TaxID=3494 RepID=A0AA88J935_FICCA|nr:hypothetical protein TIFTF001_034653 [Ficus carica]
MMLEKAIATNGGFTELELHYVASRRPSKPGDLLNRDGHLNYNGMARILWV